MNRKFIVYGLLMVSIAFFSGCKNSSGPDEHVVLREAVEGVTVKVVTKVEATDYYESSGTLKAKNTSFVSSKIMGEVKKISVNVGDRVTKGDVMLEIHSPDIEAKVEAAREGLREAEEGLSIAENNRDLAVKTFSRFTKLHEGRAITDQEFDEVKTKMDVALLRYKGVQSANKRAEAFLNEAEAFRDYMIIRSPFEGVVAEKKIDIGSMALPGTPLFIVEGHIYRVEASVDERLMSSIKIKSPVNISIDSMNIKTTGRVGEIVRRIDPNTRSFTVKVDVKEQSGFLRGGLYARVSIPVGKKEYILVNPGAIVKRGELKGVYTVNDEGVILLRLIKTGKVINGMTEVLSGLSEGDRIITDGVEKAVDGGYSNNEKVGPAGRIAKMFLLSKLTPLIVITALLLGVFAIVVTPREEEPQIVVPMVDVFVQYPGASSEEVDERVVRPMEKLLWEIKGVEYVYSIARPDMAMTIVRFYVGEDMEDSLVKLYNKLMSNYDRIPQGVSQPLIRPKSIDDVPILSLTLWSERYNGQQLRMVAQEVADELKKDPDVSEITVTGGQRRQLRVVLDPSRLKAYNISPLRIYQAIKGANVSLRSGAFPQGANEIIVETGTFLKSAEDVGNVVVGVYQGRPVYLRNAAEIIDGADELSNYVLNGFGPASKSSKGGLYDAVTISVAKKPGTNAFHITERLLEKTDALKGLLIPEEITAEITRNYGDTAKDKSDELLEHMLIAAISVTILIALSLGFKESITVAVAVPVTLALTILVNYIYGYTLNRVTLFALIFSIGILVDDAIVVVENIHRHFKMKGVSPDIAVEAVDEVGNPTILATFTVIAALMPMAFVSGLMGPYMRPIPVGASAAMLISLLIAFIISPWLSFKVLKKTRKQTVEDEEEGAFISYFNRMYERNLRGLLESNMKRLAAFAVVIALLLGSMFLVYFKMVTVKMLPFDNKSELQVIIDMPEGTSLERTAMVSAEIGEYLRTVPEVTDFQLYVGTAAPFNFNGLVRHYFLREGSNIADIQVNFLPGDERDAQSHDIAKRIRPGIQKIGERYHANVKIVEVPPGPPVLSTLVAEIYGPDFDRQIEVAEEVKKIFSETEGVVDIDWYVEDDQEKLIFEVDKEKAAYHGITTDSISKTLKIALDGMQAGLLHVDDAKEDVSINMMLPLSERASIEDLKEVNVLSAAGSNVPLSELVNVRHGVADKTIYRKNMKRVVYVLGDVAGTEESPVYAIMKMKEKIAELKLPEGYSLKQHDLEQPWLEDKYSMKWDGEWHITLEVFRDLGIAFAAVMIIIYVMIVGWFKSFIAPIVIMAPIPLSLVGILPGHAVMGAFFTATSMIGFIAGAGIVIRNSIILVDFIELKIKEGMPLKEAVVQAGIIRFRPMLLTASAVVVGSSVILFDPIFQGMAISLMAGEVASTLLSRTLVPVLYYMYKKRDGLKI